MKNLTLAFLLLSGCAKETLDASKLANVELSMKTNFSEVYGSRIAFGSIAKSNDGHFVVAGKTNHNSIAIFNSLDGVNWLVASELTFGAFNSYPQGMIKSGSTIFLSIVTDRHFDGSQYHGHILASNDNGLTWSEVITDIDHAFMFGPEILGLISISIYTAPQVGGYKQAFVDYGTLNPNTFEIINISRLATVNDEPNNFPSEVMYYVRQDGALIADVRWGEAPEIPYLKQKISLDNGLTWSDTEIKLQGFAGAASACTTTSGRLFAAGYLKPRPYVAYSVMLELNPLTGETLSTGYLFDSLGNEDVGNGQILCDGEDVYAVVNQNDLTFLKLNY